MPNCKYTYVPETWISSAIHILPNMTAVVVVVVVIANLVVVVVVVDGCSMANHSDLGSFNTKTSQARLQVAV